MNFRRNNYPEVESTVQYSTVQYNVKNVTEEGREEGKKGTRLGFLLGYADDTMYTVSNRIRALNQLKLEENLNKIQIFLTANQLMINEDITKLTEIMRKQKRGRTPGPHPVWK